MGRTCYEVLDGRNRDGQPALCSVLLDLRVGAAGGAVTAFDLQVRCRDGQSRWINVSLVAVPGESGGGEGVALVHLFRVMGEAPSRRRPLRVRLLGPVVVERPDGSVVGGSLWRRAKVRALLALLAMQCGQPVHRDTLLEALWRDLEYPAALRNLNTTVYDLRRSLEPGLQRGRESAYVQYEGDRYLLSGGGALWLDVAAFEHSLADARRGRDSSRTQGLYQEALALYRGEFLADLDPAFVGSWMERERLRELYLNAMDHLAALYREQRREGEAAELYLKALAVDPCREGTVRQLMQLALERGDRAAALAHYRRLEMALWRELQILPSQETQRLYEQAGRDWVNSG